MRMHNWPGRKTAVLVIHGIGSQQPLSTLDLFGRSIIRSFEEMGLTGLRVEHCIAERGCDDSGYCNDNYIRIINKDSKFPVDIYEYYWAYITENKMKLRDIQKWVWEAVEGARKFYKNNAELAKKCGDDSIFFSESGEFKVNKYRSVLIGAAGAIPFYRGLWFSAASILSKIPFFGSLGQRIVDLVNTKISNSLEDTVGDIAIYNSVDPKSSFYRIRKEILKGAVDILRYLLGLEVDNERSGTNEEEPGVNYGRVIIAGHSLGSQIAFDAVNHLTRMISCGDIEGFDQNGNHLNSKGDAAGIFAGGANLTNISEKLCGLVTFGSPLDKIAFFLRQQTEDDQYLRRQMIKNRDSFKQKESVDISNVHHRLATPYKRIFEDIRWYNYHDAADPISGRLDYYSGVKNIRRSYEKGSKLSTHGAYWTDREMFEEIITDFIVPSKPTKYIPR
ncbi:MAG TPA: hypothetical protein VKO43_02975 [Candidatus Krumholzibacteriaceae bacterium]|nr:hypothetical protein [Candidatus Krumholzibacteriaceae bacterium]